MRPALPKGWMMRNSTERIELTVRGMEILVVRALLTCIIYIIHSSFVFFSNVLPGQLLSVYLQYVFPKSFAPQNYFCNILFLECSCGPDNQI